MMPTGDRSPGRTEIGAILAAGYLRLLQAKYSNSPKQAKLWAPDSVESPCYGVAPEA